MYWFPFVHYNDQHQLVGNPFDHTRVMGVLQRIALGYCFASLMVLYLKPKPIFMLSVILLLAYWVILLLFGDTADPYNMMTNAGTKLDLWLLGQDHLYHGEGVPFDPEGVLSTLPAIVNVTFGYLAGKWIQQKGKEYEGLAKLLLAGALLVALALGWDRFFPINKKLWTSSFVLLTVGIDCIILAALIYVTDFLQNRNRNGLTSLKYLAKIPSSFIYFLKLSPSCFGFFVLAKIINHVYQWIFQNIFRPAGMYFGSFLFAISIMLVCWLVGYFLDKRKIYIRV